MIMIEKTTPKNKPKMPNKRMPKKITYDRLRNIALYYLGRYASSSANLRQVLNRRVQKSAYYHTDTDREQASVWIDDIVADMIRMDYIDDGEYAKNKAHSLHMRGTSSRTIYQKLLQKGLDKETIKQAIDSLDEDLQSAEEPQNPQGNLDLIAAIRYAKRRRIGVYRIKSTPDPDKQYQRDLSSLARNGFSPDICQKILGAESADELDGYL